jgi:hypothetical protein
MFRLWGDLTHREQQTATGPGITTKRVAWEQRKEAERDTKFVERGRYFCEVRAGQYWRLEDLKSLDEFLEQKVSGVEEKKHTP